MSFRARFVPYAITACGFVLVVAGLSQPVKARLGHALLDRAFEARLIAPLADQQDVAQWRPWPGADLSPVGRLTFPTLGQERVVSDNASGQALAWSVGHVPGTAALGEPGMAAIAGHRDGRFALLGDLGIGDEVQLMTVTGRTDTYVVDAIKVVDSRTVQLPVRHDGPSQLVLTTCWPIDGHFAGPERLLVSARPA